jgi:alginate O-acetyltransferase complex protein AlgJ
MSIAEDITVTATIKARTEPPMPRTVPYSECIIALHLENLGTSNLPAEFVVFLWGMRENQWTAAATFKVGQKVNLRLRPWNLVEADYGSYNRKELEDEDAWLLDVYWGEIPK